MDSQLVLSLIVGTSVGGAAAYLGSLMITKRMALVGDALGHVALPGMGLAFLLKLDVSVGAIVFLALGILLIWRLGEKTGLSLETIVGILFVSSLALGFLIVPEPDLLETLIGDISRISLSGALIAMILSAIVFVLVKRIYPGMMLLNISPELAFVEGITGRRHNLIYLAAVALIVAIGVKITGSLLVGALVIVPPATARVMSGNLHRYARTSTAIGVACNIAGILLSKITHFPPGPAIILVGSTFFLVAIGLKSMGLVRSS